MFECLLSVFKFAKYAEASKVMQGIHFMLDVFSHDKLVEGEVSRNVAIDAVIAMLQAEKSK